MKHPGAVTRLSEIDEILNSKLQHLPDLNLIPDVDPLQQSVDLTDLKATLCYSADHCGWTSVTCSKRVMFRVWL